MFDLSRVLETISSFFGSGREAAGQGSDLMSDVLAKAGLDTAFVDGLQAEAMQLLAERGIDPSALTGDQLAALINELRGGSGEPP